MSLGLLLPAGLLALLALAIPLLLHLVRRNERTRIQFAALRWLAARAQPLRRPHFDDLLLLALRLLLLALLAVWLAQPVLKNSPDLRAWVLVHPALDTARLPKPAADTRRWHWLAPGFPAIDQPAPASSASIASLLRELDAGLPVGVAMTAYVPERFDGTDAQRPRLGRAVAWKPVPGTSAFAPVAARTPIRIAAYADAAHRHALPYLRAAAAAWSATVKPPTPADSLREIATPDALGSEDTHLLWLASSAVPTGYRQWVRDGGTILLAQDSAATALDWEAAAIAWRNTDGNPLALRLADGKGAWLRMLVPVAPQSLPALLEPEFPHALQGLLRHAPEQAGRTWAASHAPVVDAALAPARLPPRPLDDWLALLVALLFGVERWLAMSMRRVRAA